jgi:hypothetical protein
MDQNSNSELWKMYRETEMKLNEAYSKITNMRNFIEQMSERNNDLTHKLELSERRNRDLLFRVQATDMAFNRVTSCNHEIRFASNATDNSTDEAVKPYEIDMRDKVIKYLRERNSKLETMVGALNTRVKDLEEDLYSQVKKTQLRTMEMNREISNRIDYDELYGF